jgi:hypothetical protein
MPANPNPSTVSLLTAGKTILPHPQYLSPQYKPTEPEMSTDFVHIDNIKADISHLKMLLRRVLLVIDTFIICLSLILMSLRLPAAPGW